MIDDLTKDKEEECKQILTKLLDYMYSQVTGRMIAYGETFEEALANYLLEEI